MRGCLLHGPARHMSVSETPPGISGEEHEMANAETGVTEVTGGLCAPRLTNLGQCRNTYPVISTLFTPKDIERHITSLLNTEHNLTMHTLVLAIFSKIPDCCLCMFSGSETFLYNCHYSSGFKFLLFQSCQTLTNLRKHPCHKVTCGRNRGSEWNPEKV